MISLDWSIIPAITIFILTVLALNHLLFKPVTRVQQEREMRTTGLMAHTRENLAHHLQLFDQYQATIKNARLEGYRTVEKARSEAMLRRNVALDGARGNAERLILEARAQVEAQTAEAKKMLQHEARELAGRITSVILQRSA